MGSRTIEYLFTGGFGAEFWAVVVTGALIALVAGVMSVLVVLKRMAFIGQGVSHAAFGGVGVAYLLGIGAWGGGVGEQLGMLGVLVAFSLLAALGIAWLGAQSSARTDTAIGIVMAVTMALGFVLLREAGRQAAASGAPAPPGVEGVLFGSVAGVSWMDAGVAAAAAIALLGGAFLARRPMVFWAFDEHVCGAFGVAGARMRVLMLCMLAVAVVVTVKLAGVVLATALFVLPGAIALRLSDRFGVVVTLAAGAGVLGMLGGLVLSFETDMQAGPAVVLALVGLFAAAMIVSWVGRRLRA